VLNCKLAIACNGIPVMTDDSGAAPNRWIVLKFTERFEGREDLTLPDRLVAEASAIAAWAVEGLRRLMHSGQFTMPQSSIEERHALNDASSPMNMFAEDRLEVGADFKTHKDELWQCYRQWCLDTHVKLCNQHQFIRSLERALQSEGVAYRKSIKINSLVRTGLTGVRLKACTDGVNGNVTPISQASRALQQAPKPPGQEGSK
jgi:phage/plasmid-associated DNA primase